MHITSLGICRASRKIYEKLSISGLEAGQKLSVIVNFAESSTPLPCSLFRLNEREYVAITPDLPIAQAEYVLAALNENDEISWQEAHTVVFENAKWKSRINYRLRKDLCAEIRCYDDTHRKFDNGTSLTIDRVTSCPSHMNFRLKLVFPGAARGKLNLVLLKDGSLEPLTSDFTSMGGRALPQEGPGAETDHEIVVSVKIPWGTEDIIAYAWEEDRPGLLMQQRMLKCEWEPKRVALDKLIYNNAGVDPYYKEWFDLHRATARTIARQKQVKFNLMPTFSVIVPLYKTPVNLFDDMIASVEAQSYANWECILVNSTPEDAPLKQRVQQNAARDERIKVVELECNLGISLNTNAGIAEASGDFICFFDHDDILEPDILFEYAKALNADPQIDMMYCDEDKLTADGSYTAASFKPDFNLDLLLCNNYLCHMLCVRSALLKQIEPNTKMYDGAQDHNLTLRVAETTNHIHHVPKVLYHWRVTEGSTAGPAESKPYATDAGLRAVQAHLNRTGHKAKAMSTEVPFTYHVAYEAPKPAPLVSIIIPSCDHIDLLQPCLKSISDKTTYENYEIIVIENNSRRPKTFNFYQTLENSDQRTRVVAYPGKGFNFSELINYGRRHAKGSYLLLLNNDTEVITCDWIERMLGNAARPEVGCVGAKLYYPDDTIQHAGVVIAEDAGHSFQGLPRDDPGYFRFACKQRNVAAVTGACLMVSAELFDAVNGFDTDLAVAYNDVDFCLRLLKRGKLNVYLPDVELYHYESVSRGFDEDEAGRARYQSEKATMQKRWAEWFGFRDPYYNRNLICKLPEACFYHF